MEWHGMHIFFDGEIRGAYEFLTHFPYSKFIQKLLKRD